MTPKNRLARTALPFAVSLCLTATAGLSQAQGTVSAAKKELVQKVISLQQPSYEGLARTMIEQPVQVLGQQASAILQNRVPAEQRDAVAKDIQAEFNKYGDEVGPIVRDRALKLAPATVGPILEEKLSEDDLKQVVAALESAGLRKFMALGPDMQRALAQKLTSELQPQIEPKIRTMEQAVTKRLTAAAGPPNAPAMGPANATVIGPATGAKPAASGNKK